MAEFNEVIKKDIIAIEEAIEYGDIDKMIKTHTYIDGKYQTVVFD